MNMHHHLDEEIKSAEHLHNIARKLKDWDHQPFLLGLERNPDVDSILANNKAISQQRYILV